MLISAITARYTKGTAENFLVAADLQPAELCHRSRQLPNGQTGPATMHERRTSTNGKYVGTLPNVQYLVKQTKHGMAVSVRIVTMQLHGGA